MEILIWPETHQSIEFYLGTISGEQYILLNEIRELIGISHVFYCFVAAVTGI